MLAFTRKPPPEDDVSQDPELLLDDADDALVPLASSTPQAPTAESAELIDDGASSRVTPSHWAGEATLAYWELRRFVETVEPLLGWRRVLFVVSGIRLRPSRSEHGLRAHLLALLAAVDSPQFDPHKEAS